MGSMCGRFSNRAQAGEIARRFAIEYGIDEYEPTYNAAPGQQLPVVVRKSPNRIERMHWGLIPAWSKDGRPICINARAEGLTEKRWFRSLLTSRRCIVPATGFYEWMKVEKEKQPFYVHLRDDELFGFAGLFEEIKHSDGSVQRSFAIITTAPNELVSKIHLRMPVILNRAEEDAWLDETLKDPEILQALLRTYDSDAMEAWAVSKEVNKVSNNLPQLVEPITL